MVTKELLDYIKKQISKGVGQDDVRKILIQYKWAENDINEAFNVINQANQPKTEKPKIEVKPLDEFRNQQVRGGVQAQMQTQPQPQVKPVVQQPAAQVQAPVQQPANQQPTQVQPQIQKPVVQQPVQQSSQSPQPQAQVKVQVVQPQAQPQPQPQVKPVVQQPAAQAATYREPVNQPQVQPKPRMQQPIVEHKIASSSFNIWPIIIGLLVFGLVIFGGIYGYNALVKNKPEVKTPVVKPDQPIVATTTKTEKKEESVQKPKIELPAQPSSDESLVKELDAVIAYLKNKTAYNIDQRNDLEKSNVLVNLGFFLQLYQSKNTKYPETLDDIMSLGKYKMLNDFSKAIYQFAYGKTPAGEFRICTQYSNGYRCFVSDDEFRTKAKTYLKNLK